MDHLGNFGVLGDNADAVAKHLAAVARKRRASGADIMRRILSGTPERA
jgi:hypothetical protein